MNEVSWSPFSNVDDVFSRFRTRTIGKDGNIDKFNVDWQSITGSAETRKEYQIKVEQTDTGREQLLVSVSDGRLNLISERKMTEIDEGATQQRVNGSCGQSWRSIALPNDVDEKRISAETMNGKLTVHLPKTKVKKPKATEFPVQIFGYGPD